MLEKHGSSRSTRLSQLARLARLARQSRTCRVESSRVESSQVEFEPYRLQQVLDLAPPTTNCHAYRSTNRHKAMVRIILILVRIGPYSPLFHTTADVPQRDRLMSWASIELISADNSTAERAKQLQRRLHVRLKLVRIYTVVTVVPVTSARNVTCWLCEDSISSDEAVSKMQSTTSFIQARFLVFYFN